MAKRSPLPVGQSLPCRRPVTKRAPISLMKSLPRAQPPSEFG